jgi:hypothetical protein
VSKAFRTDDFYAARDQRRSVRASHICLCVTAEQAPAIFNMGAGHSPPACGGSPGLRHGERSGLARLPGPFKASSSLPAAKAVLRLPRPAHKILGIRSHDRRRLRSSARTAAARRFDGIAVRRARHGQALAEVDVRNLLRSEGPSERPPARTSPAPGQPEQRKLERLGQRDEPELRGGRQRLRDVPAIEGSTETHVSRALRRHERMFAER